MEERNEKELPREQGYVPRPAWQVWGARVALVLFILVPALNAGTVGIMVPVSVLFTIGIARILYKRGVV